MCKDYLCFFISKRLVYCFLAAALTAGATAKRRYKTQLVTHSLLVAEKSSYLVLQLSQLETVKVRQRSTNLALFDLLGPSSLVPGSNNVSLFDGLLKSTLTDVTGKILEDDGSQDHATERESLTGNASSRAVDESLLLI